jgi:CDP-diacylglycerol---glycerol-3-phosphate 3-phosphatidyltransferase
MSLPDALTVARAASVPFVILLYAWNFQDHDYWATALFCAAMATDWFDGRIARRRGRSSQLGSLLDPAADKILVLAVLVMLVGEGVAPGWMVALIVVREFLVTALRLAAVSSCTPVTSGSSRRGRRRSPRRSAASQRQARGATKSRGGPCSSQWC